MRNSGHLTLEFAMILPLFVLFALMVVLFQEMMLRAVCNSHAAFAASRRCAVTPSAGEATARAFVERHYLGASMRGRPDINIQRRGGHPRVWRTQVRDVYKILWPSGEYDGVVPRLQTRVFSELAVAEEAAGTSARVAGSDNEI